MSPAILILLASILLQPAIAAQDPPVEGTDPVVLVVPLLKQDASPETISLIIRNVSGRPIRYAWSGESMGVFHLYPVLSKDGREIAHHPVHRRGVLAEMIRTLDPNEEIEWEMDLRVWYYDLPPGRYDLSMKSFPPTPEHDLDALRVDTKIAVIVVEPRDEEVD